MVGVTGRAWESPGGGVSGRRWECQAEGGGRGEGWRVRAVGVSVFRQEPQGGGCDGWEVGVSGRG